MGYINTPFLGKEYSIPQDVLHYIDLLIFTETMQKQLATSFVRLLNKKIQQGDTGLLGDEDLIPEIEQQVGKFIAKLCDNGIFTRTIRDYLDDNKGYQYVSDVNKAALEAVKSFLLDRLSSMQEGLEEAGQKADSRVTGMGFSILSGRFINHAIYAAMEASTLSKQEKEADAVWRKETHELTSRLEAEYNKKCADYITHQYIPNMDAAFTVLSYEFLDRYVSDLIEHNKFDRAALNFVNIGRSNDLLKNLTLSENKKAILANAFESCPYNIAVYMQAMKYDLLDYESFKTAKLFKHGSTIISFLEENLGGSSKSEKRQLNFKNAELLSLYSGRSLREITAYVADFIVDGYAQTIAALSNTALCYSVMNKVEERAILAGDSISKQKAAWLVDPLAPTVLWDKLTCEYGHTDLFDRLLNLLPDRLELNSKQEYDTFLKNRLFSILETIRQERVEKIYEQQREEARKKEEEAEQAKRRAKRNKKIGIICLITVAVAIIIAIISSVVTKANNAKAYQKMAGEFCVYRVINDEGEERDYFNWWLSISEDGTIKMSSWSYAYDDTAVNSYSGELKNKADYRNFEGYQIEDYCADISEYREALYCYEFHIADEWDEFDGYIVCWQYPKGKIVDVYCDDYRYSFVETGDDYSFYKWEKEIDSDGLSENLKDILDSIVNSKQEEVADTTDVEYDEYLTWYNVEFASSFLGKELNSDGSLSMGPGDYEAMSNDMYLFDIPGRFSHGMSSADTDPVIVDILDWVTTKSVDNFNKILNPLIKRYGNDYRVQHYNDASGNAYMWKDVEIYEYIICGQNADGTVDIRWTYPVSSESQKNTDPNDDTYNNPITDHTPGMFSDYQLGDPVLPDYVSKQTITIDEVNGHLYFESTDNTTVDSLYWVSANSNGNSPEIVETAHERIISYFENRYGLGKEVKVPSGVFPHYWGFDDETVTQFITETGLIYLVGPNSEYNIYVVQVEEPYK